MITIVLFCLLSLSLSLSLSLLFRFDQFPDSNILWKEVASFTDALESEVLDQHGKFLTGIKIDRCKEHTGRILL